MNFFIVFVGFLLTFSKINAQKVDTIFVSSESTTYLIFDEPISLFNLGNKEFEGKVDSPKILFLKAKTLTTKVSTLVITHGEEIFTAYLICKNNAPAFYDFRKKKAIENESKANKDSMEIAKKLKKMTLLLPNVSYSSEQSKVKIKCQNIYNDSKATYLNFFLSNESSITYEVDYVSFSYIEKRKRKSKVNLLNMGIEEIQALSAVENKVTQSQKTSQFLYALPLYSTSESGYLEVIFREKNGLRHLTIQIPFKKILQAELF